MFTLFKKTYPVGIDISDYSIEVLQLNKRREILAYGRIILEEGIVEDGKVLKKKALAAKIVEALSSTKPASLKGEISKTKVVLSLPESKVFLHFFQLPAGLAADELRARVAKEAAKIVPLAEQELCWDFAAHGGVAAKGEKKLQSVLYAAVPRSVVDSYIEVAQMAGLKLEALDVESASLGRALLPKAGGDSWLSTLAQDFETHKGTMIADIGARTTTISIFDSEGALNISSTIPVGGNMFTRSISKKLGVALEEAEEMKRSLGLDEKKPDNKVLSIIQADFQKILEEMRMLAEYYERTKGMGVGEIILAGGSSLIPRVDTYISLNLDRKVRIGNPLEKIAPAERGGAKKIFDKKTPPILFADVIGLALRGAQGAAEERNINLLPASYRFEAQKKIISIEKMAQGLQKSVKKEEGAVGGPSVRVPVRLPMAAIGSLALLILLAVVGFAGYRFLFVSRTSVIVLPEEPAVEAPTPEELSTPPVTAPAEESAIIEKPLMVVIGDTPTGWLRVRGGPGTTYAEVAKVNPAEEYELLEEKGGWYKIKIGETSEGWVFGGYATKK